MPAVEIFRVEHVVAIEDREVPAARQRGRVISCSRHAHVSLEANEIEIEVSVSWEKNGSSASGRPTVQSMTYRFDGSDFGMLPIAGHAGEYELFTTHKRFAFKRVKGRAWKLPQPAKCYGFLCIKECFIAIIDFIK